MSKKLIIAISALALAVIAGVVAVVGVFAAQQQKVANTFTISYTANNVKAWITPGFWYKNAGDEDFESKLGGNPNGVDISPEEAEQTKSIAYDIALTASKPAVKLEIRIYNKVSTGGKNMTVALTDNSVKENVNVYYAVEAGLADEDDPFGYSYNSIAKEAKKTLPDTLTLKPGFSAVFYIVIEIADPTLDAKYETTKDAGLHFTLNSVS